LARAGDARFGSSSDRRKAAREVVAASIAISAS
jgi:hypothetical protein